MMELVASFFSGVVTLIAIIFGTVVTLIVVTLVVYALVLRDSFEQGEKAKLEKEMEKERLRKEDMSDTRPIYCRYCGARPGVPSKCHGSQGHNWVRGT